jgi:PPM family protein phosphatase
MDFRSFGITDVGLKRDHNEDNFFRSDDLQLFLVADGMGGHAAGEVASSSAIQDIVEFVERYSLDSSVTWPFGYDPQIAGAANALLTGLRMANQRLCHLQHERPELAGMGTTIAALKVHEDTATLAHVGDSRIYRARGGNLTLLTTDHSWVNEQLQKNMITVEEARNHRYKNVITRALGNRPELDIDMKVEPIEAGDLFLLCSDGLSGMIEDAVMAQIIESNPNLRQCANKLVAAANEAGGADNITAVLVRCEN